MKINNRTQMAEYVQAELFHEGGGFYCAEDADSEGEEGKFYTFTPEEAFKQLKFMAGFIKGMEMSHTFYLIAVLFVLSQPKELIMTIPSESMKPETLKQLHQHPLFNLTLLMKTIENEDQLTALAPYTASYPIEEQAHYYLCFNGVCQPPMNSLEDLIQQLQKRENEKMILN